MTINNLNNINSIANNLLWANKAKSLYKSLLCRQFYVIKAQKKLTFLYFERSNNHLQVSQYCSVVILSIIFNTDYQ